VDPQDRRQDRTRRLTAEQLDAWQPLFDNARRLRELLAEMQELTLQIVDADSHHKP
jgi:hypothetical protein